VAREGTGGQRVRLEDRLLPSPAVRLRHALKPQKGIQYFVEGSSAKLRKGDIRRTNLTAFGYDDGFTFMLVEIVGDEMFFQTITERGQTVDSGTIRKGTDNRVVATAGRTGGEAPARSAPATAPAPSAGR
jgi:hypothetical protein